MRNFFLLFLVVSAGQLFAQDTLFFDRSWHSTDKKLAHYYRITNQLETGDLWEFNDYFLASNKLQYVGYFTSVEPKERTKTHTWYYESGEKKIEGEFKNDQRQGTWTYYYETGQKKKEGGFEEGYRSGAWTWWHENGTIESQVVYAKGKIQNDRLWYFTDGKIFRKGHYQDGEKSGQWVSYYNNGQKESVEEYDKGIIKGEKKSWYENGKIKSREIYNKGILSDQSKFYGTNGETVNSKTILNRRLNYNLLWEISGNGLEKPSYLLGTMHVKDPRAFKFSDSLISIFNSCEAFSMEIHPDSVFDYAYSETADELLKNDYIGKTTTRSKNYSDEWNPWTNQDLFGSRNSWERSSWVMNINQLFHRDNKVFQGMPYFLDAYLYSKARNQGKVCVGQEDIKDHIEAGKDLPKYNKNLDILSRFDPSEEMISIYEEGNIEKIRAFSNFLSNEEFNYRLLTIRNYKMANSVDSLIQLHSTFNTMGAAHLPGDEGVIEILKQKGYTLRAVKAPIASKSVIEEGNAYQTDWELLEDKRYGYRVSFPRKPILFDKEKELTYLAPDLVNETSYIAYALDLTFDESFKGKLTETFIAKYFNRKEAKLEISKISRGKIKGYKVHFFKKKYRGAKTYYRYHIFTEGRNLYFIGVGSLKEEKLMSTSANMFLNSFEFIEIKEITKEIEWTTVRDSIGAFSFSIPTNYQYKNRTRTTSHRGNQQKKGMVIYQSFDTLTGNTFSIRFRNNKQDEDKFFEAIEEVYGSYFGEPTKRGRTNDSYNSKSARYEYTIHENFHVFIKAIYRNTRTYLAIAMIKNGDTKKAEQFLNNMLLIDQKVSDLTPCYFTNEKITVSVPTTDTVYESSYSFHIPSWKLEDQDALVNSFRSIDKTDKNYSFTDSLNGVNYQVSVEHFSKYTYIDTASRFIQLKATTMYNEDEYELLDSAATEGEIPTYTYLFKNYETEMLFKRRYLIIDTMLLSLRIKYPENLKNNLPIEAFLSSYKLDSLQQTDFISQRKTQLLLDDLCSDDKLVRAEAKGALSFYTINAEELPLVYSKYKSLPDNLDTIIRPFITDAFIDILSQNNDEKSINYLSEWLKEMKKPSAKETMRIIYAISKIDLDTAINIYYNNLVELDTMNALHFPKDYANALFQPYRDSTALLEKDFERLLTLLDTKNSSEVFIYVTDEVFDNDSYDGTFMSNYSSQLLTQTNRHFVALDSLRPEETEEEIIEEVVVKRRSKRSRRHHYSYAKTVKKDEEIEAPYQTHLTVIKNLCYLLNKVEIRPDSTLINNLITSNDDHLQMIALRLFVKQKIAIPPFLITKLLANDEIAYDVVKLLHEEKMMDLLPAEQTTKEGVVELQVKYLINSVQSEKVKKIKLLEIKKLKVADEKGLLYIYEVIYEDYEGRYIIITGLQPKSKSEINYEPTIQEVERIYLGQDLNELITEMIKKYEDEAEENWEEEYNVY